MSAPPRGTAGQVDDRVGTSTAASLAEQARRLVETADCYPPCCLVAWAAGYVAGYDTATSAALGEHLRRLAEDLDRLDRTTWLPIGRESRARRIAREISEGAKHARAVTDSTGWPRVTRPGGGAA